MLIPTMGLVERLQRQGIEIKFYTDLAATP